VDLAELLHRRSEPELNTGCRLWSGGTVRGGYGGLFYEGRNIMAHRAAWLCEHGYLSVLAWKTPRTVNGRGEATTGEENAMVALCSRWSRLWR
jgi:hypothetical protein